jgi:metal-responsive CopG/Arc/MetJ family transcriptional regulator
MSAINKLYSINNKTMKKTVNIEDTLYDRLMKFIKKNYDATFSEVINVCIEEYIEKNKPSFYEKPKLETVTYRSIMIRKENLKDLQKMYKKTGISVTRLLNVAVKEFLEKYDNKR